MDIFSWLIWVIGAIIFTLWVIFPAREFLEIIRQKIRKEKWRA